jgi:hypothetical protein
MEEERRQEGAISAFISADQRFPISCFFLCFLRDLLFALLDWGNNCRNGKKEGTGGSRERDVVRPVS